MIVSEPLMGPLKHSAFLTEPLRQQPSHSRSVFRPNCVAHNPPYMLASQADGAGWYYSTETSAQP